MEGATAFKSYLPSQYTYIHFALFLTEGDLQIEKNHMKLVWKFSLLNR